MSALKFGRLTVIGEVRVGKRSIPGYLCRCECGNEKAVIRGHLNSGSVRSCGCLRRESAAELCRKTRRHGMHATPTYSSWCSMLQRCGAASHKDYHRYGGAGILVCDEWRTSFAAFHRDLGTRPTGTTLDRIDNSRGYEPGNCRWATPTQQIRNRRRAIRVAVDGKEMALVDAALMFGVGYSSLLYSINHSTKLSLRLGVKRIGVLT